MEPILTKDDLTLYAGWAMLGMAVLQAIDLYVSRATESPWRGLRSTVVFAGFGAVLAFGLTGGEWIAIAIGLISLGEAWRLSRTRSVRPELFGAFGWIAMGTAAVMHDVIGPAVFWSIIPLAILSAGASLFESWRRYRHERLTAHIEDRATIQS